MIPRIPRAGTVDTLLNTLEAERYLRGPLLATIVDELTATPGLETAADAARAVLGGLQSGQLGESEFVARVGALRDLVQAQAAPPESGEVFVRDPFGRAVSRASSSTAPAPRASAA